MAEYRANVTDRAKAPRHVSRGRAVDSRGLRLARTMSELVTRYDNFAASYQRWWAPIIEPAGLRLLDLVSDTVARRSGAVIVDLGAGTGTLARAAVGRWATVRAVAVDPSEGMLEAGRAEATQTLGAPAARRLRWVRAPADRLPLPDRSADVVVSSFAVQHLPSRIAGLREACRILQPGGAIAIVTWIAEDWPFEPGKVFDELIGELGLVRPPVAHVPRPFRSLRAAADLVRRAGFEHVHATAGVVEHDWTRDSYLAYKLNHGERPLLESLDRKARARVATVARERLARLAPAAFLYRDPVGYVIGNRPQR
jgi:ubiquinone/menaquinone biosynthesis C-methylase UbiE